MIEPWIWAIPHNSLSNPRGEQGTCHIRHAPFIHLAWWYPHSGLSFGVLKQARPQFDAGQHGTPRNRDGTYTTDRSWFHRWVLALKIVNVLFFSPTTQPPPISDTGEDNVGESHLIWMQASLNQMNSCKCGTKLRGLFFAANLEAHPIKKAKIWSGNWKEREMCRDATWQKPKLSKCVDLRALIDSWWDWNSCMAARLNLWTSIFKVMDWFMKPGKKPKWKTKSATISTHDVLWIDLCDPTTHAECEKNSQIAPAALGLSRMDPAVRTAGSGFVTNGCHISWGKAIAIYLLWWEETLVLTEGLIASPRLTQEINVFSASPARITIWRHVPVQTGPFEKRRVLGAQEHTTHEVNTLYWGNGSCPTGISTGSILKDELRVANVWTEWACNDMANASSSQAVCWRGSRKAQAVSFANLSALELPSVRNGSWQRSCLLQWAFTLHMVKDWPRWLATELNKTHKSRLSRLVILPLEKPLRCRNVTMLTTFAQSE